MDDHIAANLLPIFALAGALIAYLVAAAHTRRSRRGWSGWRTTSFVAGMALLAIAASPLVADLAHQELSAHMVQHLLVGLFAPLGLALGAPITLAFRFLPRRAAPFLAAGLRSAPFHRLSHPGTALALNTGGMALLYLTPLYSLTLASRA